MSFDIEQQLVEEFNRMPKTAYAHQFLVILRALQRVDAILFDQCRINTLARAVYAQESLRKQFLACWPSGVLMVSV